MSNGAAWVPPSPPAYPDPVRPAWEGFALAAAAAVEHLSRRPGLDLWLVTHVEDEQQVVVASAGAWAADARPGTAFPWESSFCLPMVQRRGPSVAADVRSVPAYAERATGPRARVRAYLGVPLVGDDGELFGTLCAFAGTEQPGLSDRLDLVQLVAQLLSTVLAREQVALARSQEAAAAYALADRDRLTGLRNRRGWEAVLAQEQTRCQRYGAPASVVTVDLHGVRSANDTGGHESGDELLARCAEVLRASVRPGDAVARVGGDEFAVLAVQCDAAALRALLGRLRDELRTAGLTASYSCAARRSGEDLADTWRRADEPLARERRQRAAQRRGPVISLP